MNTLSLWALPAIILIILTTALVKKVPVYEAFTEGAKDGFHTAVNIIPYLAAIIVAISMFRASGCIELIGQVLAPVLNRLNVPADVLPVIIVRPLSGSAALGLFSEVARSAPDSYAAKLAAVMIGSSETTFYVLTVYFGSVGISKLRYALPVGLLADFIGILAAILVCNYM
ncbi:MAG: spore maturation protein [Heliobacteriaceae bacterium]|jgi:spore maturation protein B|nr:spore maturation protein [Heliobacteriaceae bacterium]